MFFLLIRLRTEWTFSTNRKNTGVTNNTDGGSDPFEVCQQVEKV